VKPLVFHNSAAGIAFYGSLALWTVVELIMRVRERSPSNGRAAPEWSFFFIVLLFAAGVIGAVEAAIHQLAPLPGAAWWPVALGVVMIWSGMGFRLWSILTLGRFFKVMVAIQENHRVIDSGPYRWLRHPSYLGAIVCLTGIGVAEGDWASVAIMLGCSLVAFLTRIQVEERVLLRELSTEYASYSRRTARLVPWVF
jgi:protein-S-isoprenylcysteine O-methyltransferase Ste14